MKSTYGCPVELALDLIGGKWKTVIVARLKQGPMSYGEMRRAIPGLADKMLTQRLRELEDCGFICRESEKGRYLITEEGASLAPILEALYVWGREAAPRKGARFAGDVVFPPLDQVERPVIKSRQA